MKEATGELSMTGIAIAAVAAISALFLAFIYPAIKNSLTRNTYCSQAFGCDCGTGGADATCNCVVNLDGGATSAIVCDNPDV